MRRIVGLTILAAILIAGAWGVQKYVAYVHQYTGTAFNPESVAAEPPTYFYLDWRGDLPPGRLAERLDEGGLLDFGDAVEHEGRARRDPLRLIQACLGLVDQQLDGPDAATDLILRAQVRYLLSEAMTLLPGGVPVWPQYYVFDRYGLDAPWISALTQGQAVSLLVRMAVLTGEPHYGEWAGRAAQAFRTPGLPIVWRGATGEEGLFFEEFPCRPPSHVLNGCLLAWLGMWDWVRYSGDADYRAFCLRALDQIERRVPDYELGDWTRYDVLQRRPTSPAYQEIHAALASALHAITGDPFWGERAGRWREAAGDAGTRTRVFFAVAADRLRELVTGRPEPEGLGLEDLPAVGHASTARPRLRWAPAHPDPALARPGAAGGATTQKREMV